MWKRRFIVLLALWTGVCGGPATELVLAGGWWGKAAAPVSPIEQLAKQIDILEKHVDEFGTVVSKHPDVWGDARLTQFRADFEAQMKLELNQFQLLLQGAVTESDSGFLAQALALNAATTQLTSPVTITNTLVPSANAATGDKILGDPASLVSRKDAISNSTFVAPTASGGKNLLSISVEPAIYLDQKKRYLDHLNELRRMNEGDDTGESPGYALHLVRFPISLLPGRQTSHGYGAEITFTATPYLSDELLPHTVRSWVNNEILDRYSVPLTRLATKSLQTTIREIIVKLSDKQANRVGPQMFARNTVQRARLMPVVNSPSNPNDRKRSPLQWAADDTMQKSTSDNGGFKLLGPSVAQNVELNIDSLLHTPTSSGTINMPRASIPPSRIADVAGPAVLQLALDAFNFLGVDRDDRPVNVLDIQGFLKTELEFAFDFLLRPESAEFWGLCNDELVQAVRLVRPEFNNDHDPVPEVLQLQRRFMDRLVERKLFGVLEKDASGQFEIRNRPLNSTTAGLAWLILVHSAMLDDAIRQDMKAVAANKNCPCVSGDGLTFVGPDPSPQARRAFNEYVNCRWPVIVFALDPSTQEQNIGLNASRRREVQLVAAVAASRGATSAESLTRFVRRMELDLATIDLNKTDIGFSHGNDTFGWRFQPRLQSPPPESNLTVAARDLLIGGPSREQDLANRKLEPGMRECSAILLMPSFVPYVTFDSRSNWYRIDNPNNCLYRKSPKLPVHARVMDLQDSVVLSREITDLRCLSRQCAKDACRYRTGEVHRLLRAVEQIDRKLPLQTAYLQIPHNENLAASEVFTQGAGALAPRLDGWYGEPGILVDQTDATARNVAAIARRANELAAQTRAEYLRNLVATSAVPQNTLDALKKAADDAATSAAQVTAAAVQAASIPGSNTTLFLVGKHFNLFNLRVIAGGADVGTTEILSRNICKVTIPSSVSTIWQADPTNPSAATKKEFVDVHLATPYGSTSHLAIPVNRPGQATPDLVQAVATANENIATLKSSLDVSQARTPTTSFKLKEPSKSRVVITRDPKKVQVECEILLNGNSKNNETLIVATEDEFARVGEGDLKTGEFAGWLLAKTAAGLTPQDNGKPYRAAIQVWSDAEGKIHVKDLTVAVASYLQNISPDFGIQKLELQLYVRFPDQGARPTYKVASPISWPVDIALPPLGSVPVVNSETEGRVFLKK